MLVAEVNKSLVDILESLIVSPGRLRSMLLDLCRLRGPLQHRSAAFIIDNLMACISSRSKNVLVNLIMYMRQEYGDLANAHTTHLDRRKLAPRYSASVERVLDSGHTTYTAARSTNCTNQRTSHNRQIFEDDTVTGVVTEKTVKMSTSIASTKVSNNRDSVLNL
jgi:hypothetical protein